MNYQEAIKQLNKVKDHNLFIITGEEDYLAQRYLHALLQKLNPQNDPDMVQELAGNTDLQSLYQALDSCPFFSEKNIIYMEEPKFLSNNFSKEQNKQAKELHQALSDIPPYSILILKTSHKLDKRTILGKLLLKHGLIVECEPIVAWKIEEWLRSHLVELELDFEPPALAYLIEIIKAMENISLGFIHQELIKLKLSIPSHTPVTIKILQENLASIPEVSSFRLWETLCEGKLATALRLYDIQNQAGMHPLKILGLLIQKVRQLWEVKIYLRQGMYKNDIAPKIKVHPFIAEKIIQQANNFKLEQIELTMENLCEADLKLKTGQAEPGMMERIFIEFLKGKNYS